MFVLLLGLNNLSYATLTNGTIPVTKNGASSPPTLQNGSITDTGTSGGAGNVGIGTVNPGQALDVNGTVRSNAFMTNGSGSSYLLLSTNASDISQPSAGYGGLYEKTDKNLYFQDETGAITNLLGGTTGGWTLSAPYTYLTSSTGNVGIGTPTPAVKLDVYGNTGNPEIYIRNGASGSFSVLGFNDGRSNGKSWNIENGRIAPGYLSLHDNKSGGTSFFTLADPNDNVGIGSTNPGATLDVDGTVRIVGGSGSASTATCWCSDGITLGHATACASIVASGGCTCANASGSTC